MIAQTDAANQNRHVRLEPEEFFWARLDTTRLPKQTRPSTRSLGYLFEADLPVPIDDVHAVYRKLDQRILLACGLSTQKINDHLSHGALTLSPTRLPDCCDGDFRIEPAEINLLVGDYAPKAVRRYQLRTILSYAVMVCFLLCAVVIGLERRVRHLNEQTTRLTMHQSKIAGTVLGDRAGTSSLPPSLLMTAELRELRSTRRVDIAAIEETDAARTLEDLLSQWPQEIPVQTNSVGITAQAISIQAELPDSASAQSLATSFEGLDRWTLQQPRIDTTGDSVRTTIQLNRRSGDPSSNMRAAEESGQ